MGCYLNSGLPRAVLVEIERAVREIHWICLRFRLEDLWGAVFFVRGRRDGWARAWRYCFLKSVEGFGWRRRCGQASA